MLRYCAYILLYIDNIYNISDIHYNISCRNILIIINAPTQTYFLYIELVIYNKDQYYNIGQKIIYYKFLHTKL